MFLIDKLIAAQREASRQVAEGEVYSVDLPIVGRVPVPSPRQLAIYAALAGLAAIEVIDWPVALAMGVGSALVSRKISGIEAREEELAEAIEHEIAHPNGNGAAIPGHAVAAPEKAAPAKAAAKRSPAKKAAAKKSPAKKASERQPRA